MTRTTRVWVSVLVISTLLGAAAPGVAGPPDDTLCERLTSPDEEVRIQAAQMAAGLGTLDRETVLGLARCVRIDGEGAKTAAIAAAQRHRSSIVPLLVDVHDKGSYEDVMGAIGLLMALEPKARDAVPKLLATAATGCSPACPDLDEQQRCDLESRAFCFIWSAAPRSASDLDALWPSLEGDARMKVRALLIVFPIRMALEAGIQSPTTAGHILDLLENEPWLGIVDKGLSFLPLLTLDDAERQRAFSVLDEALNGERGDAETAARVLWKMRRHPGASALLAAAFAHPDETARSKAWAHLEELGDRGRIREALVTLLDAGDPDLRVYACARVSAMFPSETFDDLWPKAATVLQVLLADEDPQQQLWAAILLARHREAIPEVLGVLERALEGEDKDLAIQVAISLPPLTNDVPEARRLMLRALADPFEDVRALALIALVEADAGTGHGYALTTLKKMMETEVELDGLAALLYVEAGGETRDALPKLLKQVVSWSMTPDVRPRMADAIARMGAEARPHLPELRQAADQLKTSGGDDGILRSLIKRLEEAPRPGPTPGERRALAFFNRLAGRLIIELTEPTRRITEKLENERAPSTARIRSLRLEMEVFENGDFRDLTQVERNQVVIRKPKIRLSGLADEIVEHRAPNGAAFTLEDLWRAVEETERRTRKDTEWFGGIDVHHVFFEGLHSRDDGTLVINWGS